MKHIKIPALLTVLALSCGVAFAQANPQSQSPTSTTGDFSIAKGNRVDGTAAKTRSDGAMMGSKSAQDTGASNGTATASSGDSMTGKTRHAAHKAKHHAKKAAHKASHVAMNESHHDDRGMGASGSDMTGTRQSRMDSAYSTWHSSRK